MKVVTRELHGVVMLTLSYLLLVTLLVYQIYLDFRTCVYGMGEVRYCIEEVLYI
jgi:hypothetical protein